jgi:hypothetical protein
MNRATKWDVLVEAGTGVVSKQSPQYPGACITIMVRDKDAGLTNMTYDEAVKALFRLTANGIKACMAKSPRTTLTQRERTAYGTPVEGDTISGVCLPCRQSAVSSSVWNGLH